MAILRKKKILLTIKKIMTKRKADTVLKTKHLNRLAQTQVQVLQLEVLNNQKKIKILYLQVNQLNLVEKRPQVVNLLKNLVKD